ncbi:MAG: GAF domain-containing protein [Trueperaceae bacterium]
MLESVTDPAGESASAKRTAEGALGASLPKPERYAELRSRLLGVLEGEEDALANLANVTAAVHEWLPDLNWAGIYRLVGGELVLGPFQGRPACVRIAVGAGVCGTAVATGTTQVVPDVHAFPGHIACDPRSRCVFVVPFRDEAGGVVAVLYLDSDRPGTFDEADRAGLEDVVAAFAPRIAWSRLRG